jgi:hypothetical protein
MIGAEVTDLSLAAEALGVPVTARHGRGEGYTDEESRFGNRLVRRDRRKQSVEITVMTVAIVGLIVRIG